MKLELHQNSIFAKFQFSVLNNLMRYLFSFFILFSCFAQFEIPSKLKPRVSFWVDVFTKYGKHDLVFHHRHFPQAVFNVARLGSYAENKSEVQFKSFKDKVDKSGTVVIYKALKKLANGESPRTEVEKKVAEAMEIVPGGDEKYQYAIDEELVRSQTGIKERYAEAVRKTGKYIKKMESIFQSEGLPIELTRLPFIESSFDYEAYSSVGAAGIWQFMPATAKKYMIVSKTVDERRDPITATRAAAHYLRHAYKVLDSWGLALTSYNHGITGVKRKVNKYGTNNIVKLIERSGEPAFGFASANFYPEFLAAVHIYDNLDNYFPEVRKDSPVTYKEYKLTSALSLNTVSKASGVSRDEIIDLNLGFLKPVKENRSLIPVGYHLKLPIDASMNMNIKEQSVKKTTTKKTMSVKTSAKKTAKQKVTKKSKKTKAVKPKAVKKKKKK